MENMQPVKIPIPPLPRDSLSTADGGGPKGENQLLNRAIVAVPGLPVSFDRLTNVLMKTVANC